MVTSAQVRGSLHNKVQPRFFFKHCDLEAILCAQTVQQQEMLQNSTRIKNKEVQDINFLTQ